MGDDVKRYCRSCDICQRTVAKGQVVKVPLGQMLVIDTPFDRVAVDLVGPIFPATEKGYKYILTIWLTMLHDIQKHNLLRIFAQKQLLRH